MAVRDQLHTSITEPRSQLPGSVDLRRTKIHLRGSGSKQPAAAGWAAGRLRVVGGGLLLLPPPNLDLRGAGIREQRIVIQWWERCGTAADAC